jgi:hypothetical protein
MRAGLFALVLACAAAGARADNGEVLKRYSFCEGFADGVRIVRQNRRPADEPPWREVTAKGETRKVSVIDGMRIVYGWPGKDPFADVKVEMADPVKYPEDKRVLARMMDAVGRAEKAGALTTLQGRGYTGQEVVKAELAGATLAITQLFFDADKVVVSIYFPNTAPIGEARNFSNHAQFAARRAAFVRGYLECIGRQK